MQNNEELPVIQKVYDLILWYIPHVNKMPRSHKFGLGDRISATLYTILESLIEARYDRERVDLLKRINIYIEKLRYQTRLMKDFGVFDVRRYEYASGMILELGRMVGGWIKQQEARS